LWCVFYALWQDCLNMFDTFFRSIRWFKNDWLTQK
jgi:hypothetical protein